MLKLQLIQYARTKGQADPFAFGHQILTDGFLQVRLRILTALIADPVPRSHTRTRFRRLIDFLATPIALCFNLGASRSSAQLDDPSEGSIMVLDNNYVYAEEETWEEQCQRRSSFRNCPATPAD